MLAFRTSIEGSDWSLFSTSENIKAPEVYTSMLKELGHALVVSDMDLARSTRPICSASQSVLFGHRLHCQLVFCS